MSDKINLRKNVMNAWGRITPPQLFLNQKYYESLLKEKVSLLSGYDFGFQDISLDYSELSKGKIGILSASGVLPDGTPFSMPSNESLPKAISVTESVFDEKERFSIYLALPLNQHENSIESHFETERYAVQTEYCLEKKYSLALNQFVLLTDKDNPQNVSCLPVAVVQKVNKEGITTHEVREYFIPPMLNFFGVDASHKLIKTMQENLQNKIREIHKNYVSLNRSNNATEPQVTDALMLQLLNRFDGYLNSICSFSSIHPFEIYSKFVSFAYEIDSHISLDHLPQEFLPYNHLNFEENILNIIPILNKKFKYKLNYKYQEIEFTRNHLGSFTSTVIPSLFPFERAFFIVAVECQARARIDMRYEIPGQLKIAAPDQWDDYMRSLELGIEVEPLDVLPSFLPYNHNMVYFKLKYTLKKDFVWQQVEKQRKVFLHLKGHFPNHCIQAWFIKSE